MQWKPAAVADSILFKNCSNPAPKAGPTYTFGHGIQPGAATQASVEGDLAAAVWWKGQEGPTTNTARNSDVQQFWASSKGHSTAAIKNLTGRDLARSVKQASRGASVNLQCEGSPAGPQSFYKTEFCERHDKAAQELGLEANPEAYAMYCQANAQARANKALGRGSSVNLSFMW